MDHAPGDRIVALQPNREAGIVTSETFTVEEAEPGYLRARSTHDLRVIELVDGEADAKHIDHAYALTVHRSQGATYERAHVLTDGGGRELAYVACSRAKEHTQLHATADSIDQAVDDLRADWSTEHQQQWIQNVPSEEALGRPERTAEVEEVLRRFDALQHRPPAHGHGLSL